MKKAKIAMLASALVFAAILYGSGMLSASTKKVSEYITYFDVNDEAKRVNITQAANSINGSVVKPGEEFSFNKTVGPTTKARGYKEGRIFIDGKDAMGYGGGVCQVSSTLYCAVINKGLKTVERHSHSKPVKYVHEGFDAATSYGGKDFRFVNNKSYPIVIRAFVDGGSVVVRLSAK